MANTGQHVDVRHVRAETTDLEPVSKVVDSGLGVIRVALGVHDDVVEMIDAGVGIHAAVLHCLVYEKERET